MASSLQTSDFFGEQLFLEPFKSLVQSCEPEKAPVRKNEKPSGQFGKTSLVKPFKFLAQPYEYKVVALHECPTPENMQLADTAERALAYWKLHIPTHPLYDPERECFTVLLLNTRKRVKGHQFVSTGTLDCVHIAPREVFRLAIMTAAAAIILAHNHPSGEPQPSEADVRVTREIIRAGQIMRIEVIDHLIIGNPTHVSMKELGYFYT